MNRNTDIPIKSVGPQQAGDTNSECPARWVIHCICCEEPVEPWQTEGYQYGYCSGCFTVLMGPADEL